MEENLTNVITEKFSKKTYNLFSEYIKSLGDESYKQFHSKLILDTNLIGIRTPKLKEIAKIISKNDYEGFIKYNKKQTYEEKVIHGLVIGYLKINFNERLELLKTFIPYIDNWAINDIVCANLKSFKTNQEEGYEFIQSCLQSSNQWQIRFGIVLLLDFYVNDNYIDKIYSIINNIKSDEYYVKMATAWLLSICYIKYKDKTFNFLKNTKIDDWTYNKAIQKMIESKRVSKDEKNKLKELKR